MVRLLLVFAQEGVALVSVFPGLGLLVLGADAEQTLHMNNEATERDQYGYYNYWRDCKLEHY